MAERNRNASFLAILITTAILLYVFVRVHHALMPFLLAGAFAYVVNPIISYFEALGLRRSHMIIALYAAACAAGIAVYAGTKALLVSEIELLQERAPAYARQAQSFITDQSIHLAARLPFPKSVSDKILESAAGGVLETLTNLPTHVLSLLPLLVVGLLVPFIGFFFLLDAPAGLDALIQVCPSRHVERVIHLLTAIDASLGNYLRGILIIAIAITTASLIGLLMLGVDNAVAIAILAGVSSFVPYLGAAVGALAGGAMAFYQFGTFSAAFKVVILFTGIRLADEALLQPVIARHSVHLHPIVFMLALILGGETFGFIGLVFAVPAACILKALAQVSWSWYASETGLLPASGAIVPYT